MIRPGERVLIKDGLSKLFPFLVPALRDIARRLVFCCWLTRLIRRHLPAKVGCQLTDQVLDSLMHLLITIAES